MNNQELIKELSSIRYTINFFCDHEMVGTSSILITPNINHRDFLRLVENHVDKFIHDAAYWWDGVQTTPIAVFIQDKTDFVNE